MQPAPAPAMICLNTGSPSSAFFEAVASADIFSPAHRQFIVGHLMASRLQSGLTVTIALIALWLYAVNNIWLFPESMSSLVLFAPLLAVLAIGVASAANVVYHLAAFRECPKAAEALSVQIRTAKTELAANGFTFSQ